MDHSITETSLETFLERCLSLRQRSGGTGVKMQRRRHSSVGDAVLRTIQSFATRAPPIGIASACIIPEQEHDSPSLVSFDASLLAAAADSLTGPRAEVKAAMQKSMRQMRHSER